MPEAAVSDPLRRVRVLASAVAPPPPVRPLEASKLSAHACGATEDKSLQYHPQRVLFTGGAGFIGSNSLIYMVKTHPEIFFVCLDNLSEGSNRANLEPIDGCPNWSFVEGDITSESTVRSIMEKHSLDTVMHFAAQTHVDRSFSMPVQFSMANVTGTAVLLKVAHDMGIKRFLHISTDEVYGENVNGMIFDENAHHMPGNPYSASKAGAECLLRGYMSSYGAQLPIVVVRPNNIYGPRQFPEKLIPKFIYRLNRKQRLPLHGGGRSRRSFLFVEDAARAFDLVLHKGIPGEAYNIGATVESTKSVREVATALLSHFGVAACNVGEHFDVVEDRFKNDASYDINAEKIKALGWTPQVNFEEGLRRTVEWYSQHPTHWTNVDQALLAHNGACAMTRRAYL